MNNNRNLKEEGFYYLCFRQLFIFLDELNSYQVTGLNLFKPVFYEPVHISPRHLLRLKFMQLIFSRRYSILNAQFSYDKSTNIPRLFEKKYSLENKKNWKKSIEIYVLFYICVLQTILRGSFVKYMLFNRKLYLYCYIMRIKYNLFLFKFSFTILY